MRLIVCAGAVIIAVTAVQAAECTSSLREQWSVAQREMSAMNLKALQSRNMGQKYDMANLCRASRQMPGYFKLAKEYYYACDPMNAPSALAYIGQTVALTDRFLKTPYGTKK